MYYIGVDLGTSAMKMVLMREDGVIENTVSRDYPLMMPKAGWSEQAPQEWWKATVDGMSELVAGIDEKSVAGISFGGQMHGLVILDKDDNVIRPAILWNDGRTGDETRYLNEKIGEEKLAEYTANIAFAGFTAPKLLWVQKHEPQNFERICKIMLPKDYLAYKMTGVHSCDYSDASGMLLLDVKNRVWSKEMLEICNVKESQMPKLFTSSECTGTLLPSVADSLGLSKDVKVMAGAGDNAAAAVGTGTVEDGSCNISLGTSGTVLIASENFVLPKIHALHSFAHVNNGYHLMGCILSAASCNKWWSEEILGTKDFASLQTEFSLPGENEVLFAPYLMGERTPHNNPDVRGAFFGLSMKTSRGQMTQAILEGVTYAVRDSIEIARELGINVEKTKICGGGAKSPVWRQMVADIMNLPVETIAAEEGPGLGAAMLAAVGCGAYKDTEECARAIVKVTDTIYPNPEAVKKYQTGYEKFKQLYGAITSIKM